MNQRTEKMSELLRLSHELGDPHRHLSILAEGNTSAKISPDTFLVKASGSNLETLRAQDVVECKSSLLLAMSDRAKLTDNEVRRTVVKIPRGRARQKTFSRSSLSRVVADTSRCGICRSHARHRGDVPPLLAARQGICRQTRGSG